MSTKTSSRKRVRRNDGPLSVKRRRKSGVFVEYQPEWTQTLGEVPTKQQPAVATKKGSGTASSKQLSCGECRRLKLKCDRVFPCRACIRRGCKGICPDGSLVSGKGTRYVLASTEQLHDKICRMGDRIRELEDALGAVYEEHRMCSIGKEDQCLPSKHPLLQGEKLLVKDQLDLYGEAREDESPGSMETSQQKDMDASSVTLDRKSDENGYPNATNDYGRDIDASSSSTLRDSADLLDQPQKQSQVSSSSAISKLIPLFWPVWNKISHREHSTVETDRVQLNDYMLDLARAEVLEIFPSRNEAERLCAVVQENGFFILNYLLSNSEIVDLINDVYGAQHTDASMVNVALLCVLLGIGMRVDCSVQTTDDNRTMIDEEVENYINFSRAAITLHAIESAQDTRDMLELRVIQCHFLLMQVLAILSTCKQVRQQTKDAMGIVVGLVKNAELHIESAYVKYSEEEQDERRYLFYEVLCVSGEICLAVDEPAPFSSIDICQPPSRRRDPQRFPTQLEATYYDCRHTFFASCLQPVLDMRLASPSSIPYTDIMELDCKIRTFPFPPAVLQDYDAEPIDISGSKPSLMRLKLLRFYTIYRINCVLLHLHRRFLRQCLSSKSPVLAHPYFASTIATSRSAWVIVRNCDTMHQEYPELVNRFAVPWYNIFCAASALFILMERIPYCPLAPYSLRELIRAADVFDRASAMHSQIATRAAPIVRQFAVKGVETLRRWKEILAYEIGKDPILQARRDYCATRLDAMIDRIKQARSTDNSPLSMHGDASCKDDPIKDRLEIWDIAHPEIGELLTKFPSCTIDEQMSDEVLLEAVRLPLHDKDGQGSGSGALRTPLTEFFDALDHQLRRRPDFVMSTVDDRLRKSPEPIPAAVDALRDMFPDDRDLDWAALTDALVAAPFQLMNAVPDPGWTGQWKWQDPSFTSELGDTVNWNGVTDASSQSFGPPWQG